MESNFKNPNLLQRIKTFKSQLLVFLAILVVAGSCSESMLNDDDINDDIALLSQSLSSNFGKTRNLKKICYNLSKKGFLRIHHSHLINPAYIKKVLKSEGGMIEMIDGIKIRITQNKESVLNEIFEYVPKI